MDTAKIMVVDDSPVDLLHLKNILCNAGYQVVTATNGSDALEKARSYRPDVILMDVVMEGTDGFEACRNIKSDVTIGDVPVYFVTSKNQKADRVWGELQGGKGMISKPFTEEQILSAVSNIA